MRRVLPALLASLVLVASALPAVGTATAAETKPETEPITAVITEAGPHRWVDEGGPYGGYVNSVAVAASSPNIVYAGGSNGLHVSTDGAETWKPVQSLHRDGRRFTIEEVEVDPTDSNIIYASDRSRRLHKSTDGGVTWEEVVAGPERGWGAGEIEIHPKNPAVLYVSAYNKGVCTSTDRGETWTLRDQGLFNSNFWRMHIDPNHPNVLYGVTTFKQAVFKSRDGGRTWPQVLGNIKDVSVGRLERDPGNPKKVTITIILHGGENVFEGEEGKSRWRKLSGGAERLQPSRLTTDPNNPQLVRLTITQYWQSDVLLTTDGARTWRAVELPFEERELRGLRVDPKRADLLYAGTRSGLYYYSEDWGETWEFLYSEVDDPDGTDTATIELLRPLLFCGFKGDYIRYGRMVVDPTNSDVVYYADQDIGVCKTEDGGQTWSRKDQGLVAFLTAGIACDRHKAGLLHACGRSGIHKSTDGGKTWKQTGLDRFYAFPIAIHPLDSRILLAAKYGWYGVGVWMSTDQGETWNEIPALSGSGKIANFLFDPKDADTFYVQAADGLLETTDRGRTWHVRSASARPSFTGPYPAVRQTNAGIIYHVRDKKELWRSADVGTTWHRISGLNLEGGIEFVQVHARDPRVLAVAGYRGELRFSTNAGETWRAIRVPTEPRGSHWWAASVGLDRADPNVFYIGGMGNRPVVLRTRDGGKTFDELGNGLPDQNIQHLVVSPADGAVYAATQGAGVYRLEIEKPTSDEAADE